MFGATISQDEFAEGEYLGKPHFADRRGCVLRGGCVSGATICQDEFAEGEYLGKSHLIWASLTLQIVAGASYEVVA